MTERRALFAECMRCGERWKVATTPVEISAFCRIVKTHGSCPNCCSKDVGLCATDGPGAVTQARDGRPIDPIERPQRKERIMPSVEGLTVIVPDLSNGADITVRPFEKGVRICSEDFEDLKFSSRDARDVAAALTSAADAYDSNHAAQRRDTSTDTK